jgi:hypothetical protein
VSKVFSDRLLFSWSVWPRIRWGRCLEEAFLYFFTKLLLGLSGGELGAGWVGDDGEKLKSSDGRPGDEDALGIGTDIGRREVEAVVVGDAIDKRDVGSGKPFEFVAGAKGDSHPETLVARTGEKRPPRQALGIDHVAEVEVSDVADRLDLFEREFEDATGEIEEVYYQRRTAAANEGRDREIAGNGLS